MDDDSALSALSAMSNRTRLRAVKHLVKAGPEGLSAGELAQHMSASPSRASFHLSELVEAGLVTSDRDARKIIYRVNFSALGRLIRFLLEDCCQNNAEVRSCCVAG